jgi:hypothetical protein
LRGTPAAELPTEVTEYLTNEEAKQHAFGGRMHPAAVSATTSQSAAKLYGTHTIVYDIPKEILESLPFGDRALLEVVFKYVIPDKYKVGVLVH